MYDVTYNQIFPPKPIADGSKRHTFQNIYSKLSLFLATELDLCGD